MSDNSANEATAEADDAPTTEDYIKAFDHFHIPYKTYRRLINEASSALEAYESICPQLALYVLQGFMYREMAFTATNYLNGILKKSDGEQ